MSLTIHSRKSWEAAPPRCARTRRPRSSIRELFIHWPGMRNGSLRHINTISEEHTQLREWQHQHMHGNGWCDGGYNHVLFPNYGRPGRVPRIYTFRGAQYVPASQKNHNAGTISIMVAIGPDDSLTDDVERRLEAYIRWAEGYAGRELNVRGHGEVFGTECPGPALRRFVRNH